ATSDDWKSKAIYQLLTDRFGRADDSTSNCSNLSNYCGGTYEGITKHLDYISGMGFDAIWISPIPKNSDGGYHGYWATDFYQLNSNFGDESQLKALIQAAHERDMYVMLDVVANHAGPTSDGYSGYTFGDASLYHPKCTIDYNDQTSIEQCWVADELPDIDTENSDNVAILNDIVSGWVGNYSFDGIRIDTVKHIRKDFWTGYAEAAGVFATGEVFNGDPAYVGPYQKYLPSLINYPMYYALNDVFVSKSKGFSRISEMLGSNRNAFEDTSVLTTFVDNHDNPRFLNSQSDKALFKNALTYVLLGEGIPIVYYGSEQGFSGGADPANREVLWTTNYDTSSDLYQFIKTVNSVRMKSNKAVYMDIYVGDNAYAFKHGDALVVLNNYGSGSTNQVSFSVSGKFDSGASLMDIVSNITTTVSSDGTVTFNLKDGLPAIFTSA
uniref:Alpha-amylase n=1 Tax=Rhizomucor pusillus TaxID=4840 RepID=UPI001262AC45